MNNDAETTNKEIANENSSTSQEVNSDEKEEEEEVKEEVNIMWKAYSVPKRKWLPIGVGSVRLWFKRNEKELRIAYDRKEEENPISNNPAPPEDLSWYRWLLDKEPRELTIKPLLPDRPITIRPENLIRIAKGAQTLVYARIPLWARIEVVTKTNNPILEIPLVTLSKTYFGTHLKGEACYWISSGIRPEIDPDISRPYLAICPIEIKNRSEEELQINKLCLRVSDLTLYVADGQVWATKTNITFRGTDNISQIDISKKPPLDTCVKISEPRSKEQRKSFAAKTFATLKDIPGLGFLIKYGE